MPTRAKTPLSNKTVRAENGVVHRYLTSFQESADSINHVGVCGKWSDPGDMGYEVPTCLWCAYILYLEDV